MSAVPACRSPAPARTATATASLVLELAGAEPTIVLATELADHPDLLDDARLCRRRRRLSVR
ncbi:MAG: hypothetical protein R2697_10955 [Ilumatobacteraceae bacterium]